jgi:hypothetical protein
MKSEAEYWRARWRHAYWVPRPFLRAEPVPPAKSRRRKPSARAAALDIPALEISSRPIEEALGLAPSLPTPPPPLPPVARPLVVLSRYDLFAAIALAGGSLGLALHNFTGGIVLLLLAGVLAILERGDL